jgi:hypothetical protein
MSAQACTGGCEPEASALKILDPYQIHRSNPLTSLEERVEALGMLAPCMHARSESGRRITRSPGAILSARSSGPPSHATPSPAPTILRRPNCSARPRDLRVRSTTLQHFPRNIRAQCSSFSGRDRTALTNSSATRARAPSRCPGRRRCTSCRAHSARAWREADTSRWSRGVRPTCRADVRARSHRRWH